MRQVEGHAPSLVQGIFVEGCLAARRTSSSWACFKLQGVIHQPPPPSRSSCPSAAPCLFTRHRCHRSAGPGSHGGTHSTSPRRAFIIPQTGFSHGALFFCFFLCAGLGCGPGGGPWVGPGGGSLPSFFALPLGPPLLQKSHIARGAICASGWPPTGNGQPYTPASRCSRRFRAPARTGGSRWGPYTPFHRLGGQILGCIKNNFVQFAILHKWE